MANEFKIKNGLYIEGLVTSSAVSNVLTYNTTTKQVYYTASSAIGGGGSGNGFPYNGTTTPAVITGSLLVSGSVTASIISASSGITGSLFGTASYATTASFALNAAAAVSTSSLLTTASVSLNTITFTKGDGSTFPITVNTGSGGAGASDFPYTGSAIISGSLIVTGSVSVSGSGIFRLGLTNSGSFLVTGSQTNIGNTIITGSLSTSGSLISFSPALLATAPSQSYFLITGSISQPTSLALGSQIYNMNLSPTMVFTSGSQTNTALRISPFFSGSATFSSSQSNIVADFGATGVGTQFSVNDITSGSIYMVNDVSGLPIIEALSDWTVNMYNYPTKIFQKTGSTIIISGSQTITGSSTLIGNQLITGSINTTSGSITLATGSITITTGSVTMPNRPAFRVVGTSSTDILATTVLSGSASSVDYNQGNNYNNTNGLFTAPIAGLYQVFLNARVGSVNSQMQAIVYKNTNIVQLMWEAPGTAASTHFGVSGIVKLAVNDTLQVTVAVGRIQFDGNDSWGATYIG